MRQGSIPEVHLDSVSDALRHLERGMRYQLEQALGICIARDRATDVFQPFPAATTLVSITSVPGELNHLDRLLEPSLIPGHPNRAHDDMIHLHRYIMYRASQNSRDQVEWRSYETRIHRLMSWNNTDVRNWCQQIRQRANVY